MSEQRPNLTFSPHAEFHHEILPNLDGVDLRVAVVSSRFNYQFCEPLLLSAHAELLRLGVAAKDIAVYSVPGALEIPLTLKSLAASGRYDALIALGCVIRGDTYHFEVVCNDTCRAIMDVQLASAIPIANGVLTCNNDDQAAARVVSKGEDCARAAVEMARLLPRISSANR